MKKIFTTSAKNLWILAFMLFSAFTLTSCLDEDEEIGATISGHWFGDMDMFYNGERARGSEVEFYQSWSYDHGTGVQVDYYAYHAVTSYFNWRVRNGILYLTFDDPALDCAIVDYRLSYDYFSGYIADYYTLENLTHFNLRNYDRYWSSYGYGYYDYYDPYYYAKATRSAADSTATDSTKVYNEGYHGIRGVNMKKAGTLPQNEKAENK